MAIDLMGNGNAHSTTNQYMQTLLHFCTVPLRSNRVSEKHTLSNSIVESKDGFDMKWALISLLNVKSCLNWKVKSPYRAINMKTIHNIQICLHLLKTIQMLFSCSFHPL